MSAVWNSADAVAATLGAASRPFVATGLSIDTRTLQPGDLFVALKGDARDGHDFVAAALAAKASAALVARPVPGLPSDAPLLCVASTQRGLEDLARAARARTHAQIIAVTGSAGKTTTKEMLRLALGALGHTHVSAASYNNHWGVPLSLAGLPHNSTYGVFEIGMNHFGEIRALVGMVRPHVALVTTIAAAHLEFFGSLEAIADAKSEIFEGLIAGGAAIIPADSPYAERLTARARQAQAGRILRFGRDAGCDGRLLDMTETGDAVRIDAEILGRRMQFRLGAPGAHNAANAVAALLAVALVEGDVLNAAAALTEFSALKGRGQRFEIAVKGGRAGLIDESYNANPASMEAALANLAAAMPAPGARRIAVLGDMLELGADGPRLHAGLAPALAQADVVFLCGPQMASLWEKIPPARRGVYAPNSAELAVAVTAAVGAGDVVLVKGSFGSRMAAIVDALKAQTV